jgi:hypothetical protein
VAKEFFLACDLSSIEYQDSHKTTDIYSTSGGEVEAEERGRSRGSELLRPGSRNEEAATEQSNVGAIF